ncbi:receptor-like protein, partial [Striga asiatica]
MMMSGPKPSILAALFLALLFMSFKLSNCINCTEIEKQSLLSIKQSINGSSDVLSSWDAKFDCCTWKGVVCSNLTGRVLQLHIQGNYLGGKISSSLLNLKHLKYLDLSQNRFEEEIPFFVGSLTSLEYLNLSYAGFYGKVPHSIGNLSNLQVLSLDGNGYLAEVSSLEWLWGLPKLEHLNMNGVNLSKATNWAQQVINNLPSLVELHFSGCNLNFMAPFSDVNNISRSNLATLDLSWNDNFYTIIPPWFFQLSNLIYLDMRYNTFDGPIPLASNTTKLQHIDLSFNKLNSSIPQWLYSCKRLQHLDLSENELSGEIPREIANLCNIQTLNLMGNNLEGEILDSFGNNMSDCFLGALLSLDLSMNKLSGHLPHQFGEFRSLRSLYLSENSLSGVIPNEIGNLLSLEMLYLDSNKFTGNLPESIGKLANLTELYIGNNMLEGIVTETHFSNLSNLNYLDASGNHLTLKVNPNWIPPFKLNGLYLRSWDLGSGSRIPLWLKTQKESISSLDLSCTGIYGNIPSWLWKFLCNTSTNNGVQNLNLGDNNLSGELPDCFVKWQSLRALNLGNNQLSGRIPHSMGFLSSLESLNLYGNSFSGLVPSSLQNCMRLVKIDFSYNNLGGDIPKWINTIFYQLAILILRSNNFSGEISTSICQLTSLQILNLSHNRLSGRIPTCLNNLTAITTKRILTDLFDVNGTFPESASIATKGRELTYGTTLSLVTSIDLSNNTLSGEIPREVTSLVELRTLNLSRNNLTGSIPHNIGNMKQLESLDFSMNSLSGEIPGSITTMSFLNSLNLSYNHLTGRIPESTQIGGLNESSFIGNNLCGPPLKISCKNDSNAPSPTHMDNQGRKGNKREIDWFYIFLSLGYAVGLSAVLTTLYFKKEWREWYYGLFQKLWDNVYVYSVIKWRRLTRVPLYSISCHEAEKQSLLSFKQSLQGPLNLLSSWDSKVDCCTWEGVVCSNVTGHVFRLYLQGNGLGGKLNSSLLNLKHLKYLDLSFNNFHEKIPSFIGSLTSLEYLNLESAGFYGKIPHNIGNLSNLHTLSLRTFGLYNSYADSLEWLWGLSQLEHLNMNGVDLSKETNWAQKVIDKMPSLVDLHFSGCNLNFMAPFSDVNNISRSNLATLDLSWNPYYNSLSYAIIPPRIFELGNLVYLDMSSNLFVGTIPTMSNTTKLQHIDLSYNNLNSSIPNWLYSCKHLELELDNNKLRGKLPESIGKLVNLTELWIENNTLEGVVTETHFANLSNLKVLQASGNHLSLKVGPNWIPPFKLETLSLGSWDLGSRIPLWLQTQKDSISSLDLSCSGVYGNVPSWLMGLRYLNLSHNQLDGKILFISDPRHDYDILQFFDLSSNRFSGPLPQLMTSSFLELHLSNNSFSGGLSEFLCINTSNVVLVNFEGNHLSGELPECFIKWQSLAVLNLANNKFSGRIPNSIGFLKRLASLNLHGNNFSGHVPSSLQNCTGLMKIDFGDNNLGGDISKWINKRFFQLEILILRLNNFSGEITPSICQLSSLQILDLSHNRLSGRIPSCLNNFTALTTKRTLQQFFYVNGTFTESASIATKGRELTYDTILSLVTSIDLSMNNLSGDIPREVTSLVELRSLNLSRNNLTGSIPDNIGNMKQLESLDFSINSLSGNIPSFNESSFIGNNLCGSPLKISCRNDSNAPSPAHAENESGMPEINWFYVFLSLGYAVGVSAVLCVLFFKKKWREAYYAFFQKLWDCVYVDFVIKWRRTMR